MPNVRLHFGFVRVIQGTYAGRIGYYDDDDELGNAIVYFEEPLLGDYRVIPRRSLRNTDVPTVVAERFKRQHPQLVKKFGIEI